MVPIIFELVNDGHKVILGGDDEALILLSKEFPHLKTIKISDVRVRYSNNWMSLKLISLIPKIIHSCIREHRLLKKIISNHSIDVVISDNRYGLWNNKVKSILVTHQLMLKLPKPFALLEYPVHRLLKYAISNFDECWVPDYEEESISLSGDLSHKYPHDKHIKFIGPLSRYNYLKNIDTDLIFQIVVILSGPEPLRTQLEKQLVTILKKTNYKVLLIQGKVKEKTNYTTYKNITLTPHLPACLIKSYLNMANFVICRSGYSSIMDIKTLNINALLIPTPGQTEQEYLAFHLRDKFKVISQKKISEKLLEILDF